MRKIFAILTLLLLSGMAVTAMAQVERATKNIRYVTKTGKYANDGLTWQTAKNNVQDAINDLVDKGLQGEVWVARGVYTPTESTEATGGSTLYMAFKVPAGITLRGGFFGPGEVPGKVKADSLDYFKTLMGETYKAVKEADNPAVTIDIEAIKSGDYFPGEDTPEQRALYRSTVANVSQDANYPYISILSGDLSRSATFEWNAVKKYWDASFYGNSYHVVWFATNGFDSEGRAKPLDTSVGEAVVEGFTIMNGNARNNELNFRAHNAYGGGVYMTQGSRLKNCHIQQCEASRDGGGVYMDGGGVVEHCYIQNCQTLGVGAQNGYGGGICLETNKQYTNQRMGMYRSVISGCVGRMGGGAAIKTEAYKQPNGTDLRYQVFISASAIYNNTATTEAGGLYMSGGGAVSNLTITRNQCNGTGIISNNMVTGRAGGLYCRDHAVVFNSVLWGNECKANNDLQFASSQSDADSLLKVDMKYCAVSYADYTDWSATAKEGVFNISNYNTAKDLPGGEASAGDDEVFPHFNTPTEVAGYVDKKVDENNPDSQTQTQSGLRRYYDWQPGTNSVLANAGIIAVDLNTTGKLPFISLYTDVLGNDFNPRVTLGGYTRKFGTMTATIVTAGGKTEYHFFVDPNASSARPKDEKEQGVSWTQPARFLSNVLYSIYNDPDKKYDADGVKTYIHVKEGTLNNTNSYVYDKRVREMTVGVRSSNLEILGGYPRQLTGTNTRETVNGVDYVRNPLRYPTFISGRITGEYRMNAAHLMQFDNCHDVLFDGFQIRYANASSSLFDASSTDGGAIRLINGARNITFRNLIIADNTADCGAAVYAEDGTSATFENVIIHNNESALDAQSGLRRGIIHTLGNAALTFSHCNIINNVGYPAYLDGTSTQTYTNTIFFANCGKPLPNAYGNDAADNALPSFAGANVAGATGSYCLFDAASASDAVKGRFGTHPNAAVAKYQYNLNYELNKEGFPRYVNGVHNVGVSEGGDETYYGRATSFEPHNENPMVNAASYSGTHGTWGYDLSTVTPRTYGGLPDIGAIENHTGESDDVISNPDGQPEYGTVYYVRKPENGGSDSNSGLSWSDAFATIEKAISAAKDVDVPTGEFKDVVTAVNSITRDAQPLASVEELVAASYFQIHPKRTPTVYWEYPQCWWNVNGNSVVGLGNENPNNVNPLPPGTIFTLEDATPLNTSDSRYYIKSLTGYYLLATGTSGSPALAATDKKELASDFIIEYQTSGGYTGFTFKTIQSGNNYLNAYSNVSIGWYSLDAGGIWEIFRADVTYTSAQVDVIGKASVYVAAGTYAENLNMEEGVNVYGGFPATGNPGEKERDISNLKDGYKTIIDGGGTSRNKRVITQTADFDNVRTMFEGFILQNGRTTGENYGAGVMLKTFGIIKNCLIRDNHFAANENTVANMGGGGMYVSSGGLVKNSIIKQNTVTGNQGKYVGGAGLISAGGTFQNSLIVENTAYNNTNILGAGVIINSRSDLFNCTIAYNYADVSSRVPATGGVWDFAAKYETKQVDGVNVVTYSNTSQFYNCIVWGNAANGSTLENYVQIGMAGYTYNGGKDNDSFLRCYSSGAVAVKKHENSDKPMDLSSDLTGDTTRVKICIRLKNNKESEVCGIVDDKNWTKAYIDTCKLYEPFLRDDDKNTDYSLKNTAYGCINMGGYHEMLDAIGVTEDIVGANRIIDCTVDKGAYEYYDSYAITPRVIYQKDNAGNHVTDASGNKIVDEKKAATFYVTPFGRGLASADSPDNAACWQKLQRVLDAAGRYKYQHPNQQIIVKVAHSHDYEKAKTPFKYAATRTSDENSDDVRVWSIIVPRGVEVWGGYCDSYASANDNGFYLNTVDGNGNVTDTEDRRNITENPTYFDSYYLSTELNSGVNTYHVVTFTDRVFDGDGIPYMKGDVIGKPSSYGKNRAAEDGDRTAETFMLMSVSTAAGGGVTDRAVLDGIYITGGQADLQTITSGSTRLNINRYGGAAIVTDYAHVRNCIIRKNKGVYGGALALTHNALVSGCLIDQNTADYGGAIYVFENKVTLSDGTHIYTDNDDYEDGLTEYKYRYDREMPHVYSSTIVNNTAVKQGGGVWYGTSKANVRFNSTVVWANSCPDQPNVSGIYNVTRPDGKSYTTTEFYPFNYCAVQNIQASGLDNISLADMNKSGTRFQDGNNTADRNAMAAETSDNGFDKYANFGLYGLTNYSVLNRGGMPVDEWKNINKTRNLGLSEKDFTATSRDVADKNLSATRTNIEIGARAFDKHFPSDQLMLRIFVAKPEDVDVEASTAMMQGGLGAANNSLAQYYAQEGSSFAYPMTKLQDALDYIYKMRGFVPGDSIDETCKGLTEFKANNMQFEIFIGPGTYYPSVDPTGNNNNAMGATFLIPEGVSIVGGYDPAFAVDREGKPVTSTTTEKHFYGKGFDPKIAPAEYLDPTVGKGKEYWEAGTYYVNLNSKEVETPFYQCLSADRTVTYNIHHVDRDTCNKRRPMTDINANSIIEPWELKNQTILSGQIEGVNNDGVNHIVTIHADQAYVGALPFTQGPMNHKEEVETRDLGYEPHEYGQIIAIDGITFKGGYAHGYHANTVDDEHKMKYNHGGALLIDSNRYYNLYNKKKEKEAGLLTSIPDSLQVRSYLHGAFVGAAGFREIPVLITKCKFENNIAGYGGAISSNTTLDVLNSAFEHNKAMSGADKVDFTVVKKDGTSELCNIDVSYPGAGGAIYSTYQLSAINCIFANNEAQDKNFVKTPQQYSVLTRSIHALKNGTPVADLKPQSTIFGGSGGAVFSSRKGHFHFMNCNFVRNQANAYPAIFTFNPNAARHIADTDLSLKEYNQVINTVFWGNAINRQVQDDNAADAIYLFAIDKVVNYGPTGRDKNYTLIMDSKNMPLSMESLNDDSQFAEQVWFSAYEKTRGKTPKNNIDLRDMDFHPRVHVKTLITNYVTGKLGKPATDYQNCNVQLAEENTVNEGPNFVNPSAIPGYDGYMESADWGPARLNSLTDYGWGKIKQEIFLDDAANTYRTRFVRYGEEYKDENGVIQTYTVPADRKSYSSEKDASGDVRGDYVTWGAYTTLRYLTGNEKYNKTMPLGNDEYMYTTYNDENGNPINLYRISYDPSPTHDQTYIDIGVYEYHHTQLEYTTEGDEVDVIWVSPVEKPDNGLPDGSAWSQPTSDMQRAIETLLSSRNGHRKEIRMMDGTFIPTYTINNHLAFYIDTEYQNKSTMVELDKNKNEIYDKGVMSLTIKGGYSRELNGVRDVEEYPAVIRQQQRTDADDSNARWDHLFYIADPTQRYGKENYGEDNGYGLRGENEDSKVVNTVPIYFDGLTLINDNASAVAKNASPRGAVIHYADLDTRAQSADNADAPTDGVITPTPTNVTTKHENADKHDWDVIDVPAKIIISKTKIYGSGAHDQAADRTATPAVYLGTNGGYALLYNNVLHSNYGDPLVAMCETRTINNTFALNGGSVELGDVKADGSFIRNTVLWRNNYDKTAKKHNEQFSLYGFKAENLSEASNEPLFSYNAFTGGDTVSITYADGSTIDRNHHNVGLIDNNEDLIYSPHFVDPLNPDLSQRDFSLQPSLRLLHKGSTELYDTLAVKSVTPEGSSTAKMEIDDDKAPHIVYDLAYDPSFDVDAANNPRIINRIDIGAYEYQNDLNRVIYFNPNLSGGGDGLRWNTAFGLEENKASLQDALNLAALYHVNHPEEQAYVFVKGASTLNKDLHIGETLTIRNGVSVYGGIHPSFTTECVFTENKDKTRTYSDADIKTYVESVEGHNEGHIGPNTNKTTIRGLKTSANTVYDVATDGICSLMNGFHITAKTSENPTGKTSEPLIDVAPQSAETKVVLQNIVVFDTDISGVDGGDIARLKNALLYEALLRSNTTADNGAVLRLDENAWAVSITAQGRTATKVNNSYLTPFNGYGRVQNAMTEKTNRIVNSIVNYGGQDTNVPASEADKTRLTLSGHNYRRNDLNMYFQLTEGSRHINEIEIADVSKSSEFLPVHLRRFVNYGEDRDLLGNPRLLTLKVNDEGKENYHYLDRGAFETWKIEKDVRTSTDGHFTPHTGSVVYIMKGKNLICGTELQPGFLLLREGASLYGNGHNVKSSFISVERTIHPNGTVMSLPFEMDYSEGAFFSDGVAKPTYKDAPENDPTEPMGELILTADPGAEVLLYNGSSRSEWNHEFDHTSSDNWEKPASTLVPANQGVFFKPSGIDKPTLYAFTSMGASWYNNVYEEDGEKKFKQVKLTQYDDRKSETDDESGHTADFTSPENMGWNCIGLPYLVSNYQTHGMNYAAGHGFTNEYNMHLPHTLWLYYDGKVTPDGSAVDGDGGFYSVPSWLYTQHVENGVTTNNWHLPDNVGARIWVGEGIFLQTAAVAESETLTFYRPLPIDIVTGQPLAPSTKPAAYNARYYSSVDIQDGPARTFGIRVHERTVYVYGLDGDEHIAIYDTMGRCHMRTVAAGAQEWTGKLPDYGVFIIAVDDERQKILAK